MLINGIRVARGAVRVTWLIATVGVLALAAIPHMLPTFDRELYIVRGASMQPAIPLGGAIVINHVEPAAVRVGDVITFRAPNAAVVTHRVVGIAATDPLSFATKGDASQATDAVVVPGSALIGHVEFLVPGLGVLLTVLGSTLGAVATLGMLGGLLLAVMFMDELLVTVRGSAKRRAVLTEPAH